ncbi:MAG: PKD domain-containing protein [Chitinophagaceae bacterium]
MRKCQFILAVVIFLLACPSYAQKNNIWYFGKKAGLDFNRLTGQAGPAVLTNSAMDADEGCASVCDDNGNLLFYSNGLTVYNRKHQVMLNGDGLLSNSSALQGCIILPVPGNHAIFYIFTTDALENGFANGYRYSIVDMSLDNGNGQVISKNILLSSSCTERMTAVRHADGVSVWLITNDNSSDVFRSWLITCTGLQPNPVISVVGVKLDGDAVMNIGMLKASPDGKQVCQTAFLISDDVNNPTPNFSQLFKFDNQTGILSNPRSIEFPRAVITTCEFSPNSQLLYLVRAYDKAIEQVEATLPTAAAIIASDISIRTDKSFYGIQLAPDGKIYLAQPSFYLAAINNPDIKGTGCDFQKEQVDLDFHTAYLGLPAFINDLSFNPVNSFTYSILDSCNGTVQFQGNASMPGTIKWQWDFGDGNTSTIQNPVHIFSPPEGPYTVKLIVSSDLTCDSVRSTKIINPKGILTDVDFDFFPNCDSGYIRFTNKKPLPTGPVVQYLWDFGDGNVSTAVNPVHTYAGQGSFPVKLKLVTGKSCLDDSVTKTVSMQALAVAISADQSIFLGQKIQLFVSGPGNVYQWSPSTGLSNTRVARPIASPVEDITYKAKVIKDGCSGEDSVHITIVDLTDIYVPTAFTPNNDGRNDAIKPFFGTKFTLREFSIFNRWGERVFASSKRGEGWNGKIGGVEQNPGVYIWVLKYTDDKGRPAERKGSLLLLR